MKTSKNIQSPKISKAYQSILDRVSKYETIKKSRDLTQRELVLYINAKKKVEDKSLSQIFKMVMDKNSSIASEVKELLGTVKPTFKTLQSNMGKVKAYYSTYDVICALARMNPTAKLATKLAKQGGKTVKAKAKAKV